MDASLSALIIFIEKPEAEAAARLAHEQSLVQLRAITTGFPGEKFVFYPDYPNWNDAWDINVYRKRIQHGDTGGERMAAAFGVAFEEGHDRALIIAENYPEITSEIILEAMEALNENDVVVGPAAAGGFYLLGLKSVQPEFLNNTSFHFKDIEPRTSTVLPGQGLSCYMLPEAAMQQV